MSYTLKDVGFAAYKHITLGRKQVGRVARHAEGGFVGVIGKVSARAATEYEAFAEVVARDRGFASAAAMDARDQRARRAKRQYNQAADIVGRAYIHSDLGTQMKILDRAFDGPPGATELFLHGVTRQLFRK